MNQIKSNQKLLAARVAQRQDELRQHVELAADALRGGWARNVVGCYVLRHGRCELLFLFQRSMQCSLLATSVRLID